MQARTIPLFLVSLIVLLPPGSQSGQSAECVNQFTKSVIRLYPDKSGAVAKKINVVDIRELKDGCLKVHDVSNARLLLAINGERWWIKQSVAVPAGTQSELAGTSCITVPAKRSAAVRGAGECRQ
ncbi:MAG: hypothetical protein KDI54_15105 [Gammaproteobacteria bacterium]|nr:hypothetical protein [Gammaproteobacteria bacterium]